MFHSYVNVYQRVIHPELSMTFPFKNTINVGKTIISHPFGNGEKATYL